MGEGDGAAAGASAGTPADAETRLHAAFIRALRADTSGLSRQKPVPQTLTAAVAALERTVANLRREREDLLRQQDAASVSGYLPPPPPAATDDWRALLQQFPVSFVTFHALAQSDAALTADLEAALSARAAPLYPLPLEEYLPFDDFAQIEYWAEIFAVFDAKHAELLADARLPPAERQERLADWLHRQRQFVEGIVSADEEEAA